MSSRSKVPVTFTFHRRGVHPPLFVAGSFSNPPWQPQKMDASIDQHGDYIFTKRAMVDECSEIQYKFRHASGDWWALDPDADTVTDDHGNINSLLYSPTIKAAQEIMLLQETHSTKPKDTIPSHNNAETSVGTAIAQNRDTDTTGLHSSEEVAAKKELRRLSSTPIEEVANTAAEVADTASQLDEDESEVDGGEMLPMFSHECFASSSSDYQEPKLQHDNLDYPPESVSPSNMNFDDPRLEHFPSDRDSIMATMRRVSTSIETDSTTVDEVNLPPIITARSSIASNPSQTRDSFDADDVNAEHENEHEQTEDMNRQPASIAPMNSLQSIAEGDEAPCRNEARDLSTPVQHIGPVEKRNLSLASSGSSNEDEGVAMSPAPCKHMSKTSCIKKTDNKAQPPTLIDEASTINTHPTEEHTSITSSSSKFGEQNDQSGLQKPTNGERSHSPLSTYSIQDSKKGNWIHTFFHTIFVDWFGDLFCWLCSRSRSQV
ncbi:hypothetical protein F5Y12DRAFT_301628 [Xylaria sp. FL1777]|nr:hypothetical protein F5Y12DRAFT_301628 [Xylaria sp. FL1777]